MNRPNLTRCPAPARTDWGVIRCVSVRGRCTSPGHSRWRRVLWPMAVAWAVRPWWPNARGRAADRGDGAGRGRAINAELGRQDGAA